MNDEGYVPTLLEYAYVIEWMEDHPTGDSLPEELRAPFTDALNRAELGRVAAAMSRAYDTADDCASCGFPLDGVYLTPRGTYGAGPRMHPGCAGS